MKKFILLLFMVAALMMTACGNEGSENGNSETNESSNEAGSDDMTTYEKIMASGKMTVATEAAMEPLEYVDENTGEIVGFGPDILAYICEDWGVEVEQLDLPWQGILPGLEAGQYDFVATSVTMTAERAEQYDFTQPIAATSQLAVKLKGNDNIALDEDGEIKLDGLKIGVHQGGASEIAIEEYNEKLLSEGKAGYGEIVGYASGPEVYLELQNGHIDLGIQDLSTALCEIKKNPDIYESLGEINERSYYGWVCRKGDEDLVEAINASIQKMIDDGTMKELQEKWLGESFELPTEDYIPTK